MLLNGKNYTKIKLTLNTFVISCKKMNISLNALTEKLIGFEYPPPIKINIGLFLSLAKLEIISFLLFKPLLERRSSLHLSF